MSEKEKPQISIIIPVYHEADRIKKTIQSIEEWKKTFPESLEVIFSDDGSKDQSGALIQSYASEKGLNDWLKVKKRKINHGKGNAIRSGLKEAQGIWSILLDADLAVPLQEIPSVLQLLKSGKADLVCGKREKGKKVKRSLLRSIYGSIFRWLVQLLLLPEGLDTQCPCKGMKTSLAKELFQNLHTKGFLFDVEILYRAKSMGKKITALPVSYQDLPGSKVRPIRDGLLMMAGLFRLKYLFQRDIQRGKD